MPIPLRIVGDTNFWISVAGWRGAAQRLHQFLQREGCQFLTSTEILAEIGRVLKLLPDFNDQRAYEWYCEIGEQCELVPFGSSLNDRITLCRDADDNKFLEYAVWGHADTLISRDKDLLSLNGFQGIQILTPEQIWRFVEPS